MSTTLPLTNVTTWMDYFIILNIATVTFIIIETCIVFYFTTKKKIPPQWYALKLFVYLSSWTNLVKTFYYIFCCACCRRKKKETVVLESHPHNDDMTSKTLPRYSGEFNESPCQIPIDNKDDASVLGEHSDRQFTTYTSFLKRSSFQLRGRAINESSVSTMSFKDIENLPESHLTWTRLGLAIDVLWQILISVTFIIFTSILLVQAVEHR